MSLRCSSSRALRALRKASSCAKRSSSVISDGFANRGSAVQGDVCRSKSLFQVTRRAAKSCAPMARRHLFPQRQANQSKCQKRGWADFSPGETRLLRGGTQMSAITCEFGTAGWGRNSALAYIRNRDLQTFLLLWRTLNSAPSQRAKRGNDCCGSSGASRPLPTI